MWKGESANRQDFEQKVYKQGDVESDQEERRNAELISRAGKNVGGLPVNIFGIFDQEILCHHTVVCRRWNGEL